MTSGTHWLSCDTLPVVNIRGFVDESGRRAFAFVFERGFEKDKSHKLVYRLSAISYPLSDFSLPDYRLYREAVKRSLDRCRFSKYNNKKYQKVKSYSSPKEGNFQ